MLIVWGYLKDTFVYVLETLLHNLPVLAIGIFTAAAISVYVDTDKMRDWLLRRTSISVPAAVAFGAFTPFCACGTMAVVLSMMATALPWGAIMAFLTSSPLMSPDEFILISGIVGVQFAIALAIASVFIGVGSGYLAAFLQKRTRFFEDQLRFSKTPPSKQNESCSCCSAPAHGKADDAHVSEIPPTSISAACCAATVSQASVCCAAAANPAANAPARFVSFLRKRKVDRVLQTAFDIGVKKILPLFTLFAAIGYLINRLIPLEWIESLFGAQNIFAVPLAAAIGLPLYVNGASSIPLMQSLMESGVSRGAMLAFLITGPGTSAGVLAGIATIMKKRAIVLYAGSLLVGAILLGYLYNLILALL